MSTPLKPSPQTPVSHLRRSSMINNTSTSKLSSASFLYPLEQACPLQVKRHRSRSPPKSPYVSLEPPSAKHGNGKLHGPRHSKASEAPVTVHTPTKRANLSNWERITWAPKKTHQYRPHIRPSSFHTTPSFYGSSEK